MNKFITYLYFVSSVILKWNKMNKMNKMTN